MLIYLLALGVVSVHASTAAISDDSGPGPVDASIALDGTSAYALSADANAPENVSLAHLRTCLEYLYMAREGYTMNPTLESLNATIRSVYKYDDAGDSIDPDFGLITHADDPTEWALQSLVADPQFGSQSAVGSICDPQKDEWHEDNGPKTTHVRYIERGNARKMDGAIYHSWSNLLEDKSEDEGVVDYEPEGRADYLIMMMKASPQDEAKTGREWFRAYCRL